MNDYQVIQKANAAVVRQRLATSTHEEGQILSVFQGHEAFRPVNVHPDNSIFVLVSDTWRPAYVDPTGLRALTVR